MAFRVLQPCHRKWESLEGDGVKRHCEACGHAVYDLSAFTEKQVGKLLAQNGKLCGRGVPAARRSMLAAMLSLPLFSQSGGRFTSLKLYVRDPGGALLPRVSLVVLDDTRIVMERYIPEGIGTIRFVWTPRLILLVFAQAFRTQRIELKPAYDDDLTVVMQIGEVAQSDPIGLVGAKMELQLDSSQSSQRFAKLLRWLKPK